MQSVHHPTAGAVDIRTIPLAELDLIRPLFRQVFNTDISAAMLEWKYGGGRGVSYGAFAPDGRLLAHCGLFFRTVLADGVPRRIAQLGDLMALPGRYGGLSRGSSPFALLVRSVLADLPEERNPDSLAFGFPSDRAMRLGEHLGLFASIDRMHELTFAPASPSWRADRCTALHPSDSCCADTVDALWQRMASSLGSDIVGVRDAVYLEQRYFRHPLATYSCHLISSRWRGRPLGILVTRSHGGRCEILDMLAHPADMPRLLLAARRQMSDWGAGSLTIWLTGRHAAPFRHAAESVKELEIRIMANPFSSGGDWQRFSNRWWLTGGDTDYL